MKKKIDSNIKCPACTAPLEPRVMVCEPCGIRVEGQFAVNEFTRLTPDDLHFLRVYLHCEGRIRDVERALGVSYPTVKARVASLRQVLSLAAEDPVADARTALAGADKSVEWMHLLAAIENGSMSVKEVIASMQPYSPEEKK